jgi:hypothetical protein
VFVKLEVFKNLAIFGSSMIIVNGEASARHGNLIASCYNERVSMTVWNENFRHISDISKFRLVKPDSKFISIVQD